MRSVVKNLNICSLSYISDFSETPLIYLRRYSSYRNYGSKVRRDESVHECPLNRICVSWAIWLSNDVELIISRWHHKIHSITSFINQDRDAQTLINSNWVNFIKSNNHRPLHCDLYGTLHVLTGQQRCREVPSELKQLNAIYYLWQQHSGAL